MCGITIVTEKKAIVQRGPINSCLSIKETNTQHSGHIGNFFQNESAVKIYSKSLFRVYL